MPLRSVRSGPLPARFAPVNRAFAGPVAAAGRLVDRPVHRGLGQVEAHDAVIGAQSLIGQRVEHPRVGPLVAARPQSSVRRLVGYQTLRGDPRASRDQPDHDPIKAHPVRDPRIVTAQWMIITATRQQRLRRRPHRIHHLRVQRAHNDRNLHLVVVVGTPESSLGDNPTTGGWSPTRARS